MKILKLFLFYILFLTTTSFSQTINFAWLTDLHIGATTSETDLAAVVNDINLKQQFEFVIISGDITEKGRNSELIKTKEILDRLKIPYYIVPGNHDSKWSESGTTKFSELWKDDKFVFEKNNFKFIGLNSGITWRGGGGHIAPEDLLWLDSIVTHTPKNKKIIYVQHHQLHSETDNWFKVTNILRKAQIEFVLVGHGHANKQFSFNGIPGIMGRSTLSKEKFWGYNFVQLRNDSAFFTEVNPENKLGSWLKISLTDTLLIPKVDSLQFINKKFDVHFLKEHKTTLLHSPITYDNKIFVTTKRGFIYCYDLSGNLLWRHHSESTIISRPNVTSGLLIYGTVEGELISLEIADGSIEQSIGIGEPITSQISFAPIRFRGEQTTAVIFGTASGKVYCYDIFYFFQIWENNSATAMIESRPIIVKNRVIFGSWDGFLYCLSIEDGKLNWRWSENRNFYFSPAASIPVFDEDNIYVPTPDKFVSAIDIFLGKTVWRKDDFSAWESIGISQDKKNIFIKSHENNFFIVESKSGKMIKKFDLKTNIDTNPTEIIESGNNIFISQKNGWINFIDEKKILQDGLFLGSSRVNSLTKINDNLFAATNMDGLLIVFSLKK